MYSQTLLFLIIFVSQSILAFICLLITIKISLPITFSDVGFDITPTKSIFLFSLPVGLIYTGISYAIFKIFYVHLFITSPTTPLVGATFIDIRLLFYLLFLLAGLLFFAVPVYLYLIDRMFRVFNFRRIESVLKVAMPFCFIYCLLSSVSFLFIMLQWFK